MAIITLQPRCQTIVFTDCPALSILKYWLVLLSLLVLALDYNWYWFWY